MAIATATHVDQRARSLELAQARGHTVCSWAARTIGWTLGDGGELVNAAWRVESASSDAEYIVSYTAADDRAECACQAAQHHRPCWHAGLALMKGRYLAHLYSPAGRAEAEYEAQRAAVFEDNMRALGYGPRRLD